MASMSHREYKLRIAWLQREAKYDREQETRTDWYLMQIAQKVQQTLTPKKRVTLESMKLRWKTTTQKKDPAASKQIWLSALGVKQDD